jgi:hypothetical protein
MRSFGLALVLVVGASPARAQLLCNAAFGGPVSHVQNAADGSLHFCLEEGGLGTFCYSFDPAAQTFAKRDAPDPDPPDSASLPPVTKTPIGGDALERAANSSGTLLAATTEDKLLRVFDLKTGRQRWQTKYWHEAIDMMKPCWLDGDLLYAVGGVGGSGHGFPRVLDGKTGKRLCDPRDKDDDLIMALARVKGSTYALLFGGADHVEVWDFARCRREGRSEVPSGDAKLFASADGARIFAIYNDGSVTTIEGRTSRTSSLPAALAPR